MKIPKQKVFYISCLHNMGEGDTFQLEGGHYHTHQEAHKAVNQMQSRHPHELFCSGGHSQASQPDHNQNL